MEIKEEYQSIFDLVNQIISHTNGLIYDSGCQDKTLLEDIVLTEMNDLLLGIENGKIYLADSRCLGSTYYVTDGAIEDKKLASLISTLQRELDKNKYVKKHNTGRLLDHILRAGVVILSPSSFVFLIYAIFENPAAWGLFSISMTLFVATVVAICRNNKKNIKWNYQLFPNLPYQNCQNVIMAGYKDEDILVIQYDDVVIDLGYIEDEDKYYIIILKKSVQPSKSIIEQIAVEKRYLVERVLLDVMKKYENYSNASC